MQKARRFLSRSVYLMILVSSALMVSQARRYPAWNMIDAFRFRFFRIKITHRNECMQGCSCGAASRWLVSVHFLDENVVENTAILLLAMKTKVLLRVYHVWRPIFTCIKNNGRELFLRFHQGSLYVIRQSLRHVAVTFVMWRNVTSRLGFPGVPNVTWRAARIVKKHDVTLGGLFM